ncbi:hypothetical protein [Pseudidiomarina sp.]|uniref:hypothetical protein n=1 Tax=Pseudidiomarina sp. TaxID=2081707 RepID=UPI003A984B0F
MSKLVHLIYWVAILVLSALLWRAHNDTVSDSSTTLAKGDGQASVTASQPAKRSPVNEATNQSLGTTSKLSEQQPSAATPVPQEDIRQVATVVRPATGDEATERMMAQLQRAQSYPERLQREGVDQDWNYQVSSDVERIFSEVTGLSEDYLGEVNCRMSLCEVQVSASTTAPIDTMMRLQKALIDMPWYTEDYSTIFDATDKNGYYRIYLERESP